MNIDIHCPAAVNHPENQLCINLRLKTVPNKCTIRLYLISIYQNLQCPAVFLITYFIDALCGIVVRQQLTVLLRHFGALSRDTLTHSQEEPGIKPVTLGFID